VSICFNMKYEKKIFGPMTTDGVGPPRYSPTIMKQTQTEKQIRDVPCFKMVTLQSMNSESLRRLTSRGENLNCELLHGDKGIQNDNALIGKTPNGYDATDDSDMMTTPRTHSFTPQNADVERLNKEIARLQRVIDADDRMPIRPILVKKDGSVVFAANTPTIQFPQS
jgi:hypothetical protein